MSIHYRLYPPFLYIAEDQDFSKAWERFCCKLLNLSNSTNEIYVRNPPEQGVDIFFPSKKVAYQCKSVESGKSGDFNVTKTIESIHSAQQIKSQVGWEEYVLCTNIDISGTAEAALKKELPSIKIFSKSFWIQLCESYPLQVERNFRRLIEIPPTKVFSAIESRFVDSYSSELQQKIKISPIIIFLYSNRHDSIYRFTVSQDFSCNDLLEIFRAFFQLPESATISSEGISISLSHSVVIQGKKVPLNKTLKEATIGHGDIVTYWTTVVWKDAEKKFEGDMIHMIIHDMSSRDAKTLKERSASAIAIFNERIKECFVAFDNQLLNGENFKLT